MGVEFYITRADFWADNDDAPITSEEWLGYINSDNELHIDARNGENFALWSGPSHYEESWLEWYAGNIYTKWPDTSLYKKMLSIATCLNAHVMDDNGTLYRYESQWEYDPSSDC